MKNRKVWFILLSMLIATALLLTACGKSKEAAPTQAPEPTKAPAAAEPTKAPAAVEPTKAPEPTDPWANVDPSGQTVVFWHQHSRAREEALQEIVQAFNDTNEWGITVDAEYQGGYSDIFNKMLGV
ncbi:MAG: hypothetical protein GXP37_05395, partial [Chloroflexi bacterium]|nr:hypothetical protein [Chloroflexota bacterium]